MKIPIETIYHVVPCCINCNSQLSNDEKFYSRGCCPKCGYKGPSAGTTVDTYDQTVKKEVWAPWWKFWVKNRVTTEPVPSVQDYVKKG